MNSRSQTYDLKLGKKQVEEAVSAIFNTILLSRTLGKFNLLPDGSYAVGTVGYQDVDCHFIDLTYTQCSSTHLQELIRKQILPFLPVLFQDSKRSGQITLEFFERKKSPWPFPRENVPWEIWNIRVDLLKRYNEDVHETVSILLEESIIDVVELVSRDEYLPAIPVVEELSYVFNTDIWDVQPYLFNISFKTSDCPPPRKNPVTDFLKTSLIK